MYLKVRSQSHDFGTYYEVVCEYEETNEQAVDYAFKCEGEGPLTWTEVGMEAPFDHTKELNIKHD